MTLPKELTTVTKLSKMLALILFIALPIAAFFFGRYYEKNYQDGPEVIVLTQGRLKPTKTPTPKPTLKPATYKLVTYPLPTDAFDPSLILYSYKFVDSQGQEKSVIFYKTDEKIYEKHSQANFDVYIVDSSFSPKSTIEIPKLNSRYYGFLYYYPSDTRAFMTASPALGKKYILYSTVRGDSTTLIVFDENGKVTPEQVVKENITNSIRANKLTFTALPTYLSFDSWRDNSSFYVIVSGGKYYKILIDAGSGNTIGSPETIK